MVSISPEQLPARLKAGLAPLYVVAGDEPLLVQESADLIRRAASAAGFAEREVLVNESGFDWKRLNDQAQSLSLFASQRRIELYLERSPGVEGAEALRRYAAQPPSDVVLLIVAGALEKAQRESVWFKALEAAGVVVYAWPVKDLRAWLVQRARALKLQIQDAALNELEWRLQGNLLAAAQTLARLKLLCGEQEITAADIIEAVGDAARYDGMDMVEAALEGRVADALRRLDRLRGEEVSPAELVGALAWALRALAVIAEGRGPVSDAAWRQARVFGEGRGRFQQALKRLGPRRIARLQVRLARAERSAKGAAAGDAANDPWQELIKLCAALGGIALPQARHLTIAP